MTPKSPLGRFSKEFCSQKLKANKIMKEQAIPNHRRRKGKKVESNTDSASHNQILKQQRHLNVKDHHIPINITLNMDVLNSSIKRHRLANWTKKDDPTICCLQETHIIERNKHWLRVKVWMKI
jgi:hypothetical protein